MVYNGIMMNQKNAKDLQFVVANLIDEVADIQYALNNGGIPSAEQLRDFYSALDFAEYRVARLMGAVGVDLDGVYSEDEE